MVGYEVSINGENISAAIDKGVLNLVISRVNNDFHQYLKFSISGLDTLLNKRLSWSEIDLKEGDEIRIKIKDIDKISSPVEEEDPEESLKKQRLTGFYMMKERLEKAGLI